MLGVSSLKSLPDSRPEDEQAFSQNLLFNIPSEERDKGFSSYHSIVTNSGPGGLRVVEFDNWVVDQTFQTSGNGFGLVLLRSRFADAENKRDYLVTFRGTDGLNNQDWFANLDLAIKLWNDERTGVINALLNKNDAKSITFTGQSLGGGLAQYGLYSYLESLNAQGRTDRPQMALITFNGFGGVRGLRQMYTDFDPAIVQNIPTAHFVVDNDMVHRLGAGSEPLAAVGGSWHLNGKVGSTSNIYQFNFARYDANGIPVPHSNGKDVALPGIVDAHRIESGFYRGIENTALLFSRAESLPTIAYIDTAASQSIGAAFSRLFNKGLTNEYSAGARLIAGLLAIGISGDLGEIRRLAGALAQNLDRADERKWAKVAGAIETRAGALALKVIASSSIGVATAAASLMVAKTIEMAAGLSSDEKSKAFDAVNSFLPEAKRIPTRYLSAAADLSGNDQLAIAHAALLNFGRTLSDSEIQNLDFDSSERGIIAALKHAQIDDEQVAQALNSGEHWAKETLTHLDRVLVASPLTAMEREAAVQGFAWDLVRETKRRGEQDASFFAQLEDDIRSFLSEDAAAVANISPDVLEQKSTSITFQPATGFIQVRDFADAFLENLKRFGEQAIALLTGSSSAEAAESIQRSVKDAAQTVVINAGHSANPFDNANFDPDASPPSVGQLKEGSVQTFTAYLPYEAGPGGQRIKFTLAGAAADKLTVWDEEIALGADGTFTLTVAEGQREISFAVAALEDVDTDETFTLSATLVAMVDGTEVATHLTHEEATVTLDAEDEVAPIGGMELHGDWGPKLYQGSDAEGNRFFYTLPDPRYPHGMNVERDPGAAPGVQGQPLMGLDGADHIWTGDQWVSTGWGGDDYIEGKVNVPNLILGDATLGVSSPAGNDMIEGGENDAVHFPDGQTFDGEKIETSGDDILLGGPGDDEIYADRMAVLEQTLDPATPALDFKGDWISGEQGDDRIFGSAAHDALFGGGGADEIHAGAGNDVLDGDDNYHPAGFAFWEIDSGFYGVTFFPVTNIWVESSPLEYYRDFGGDDVLDGGAGDDLILGMLGADTLIGGEGEDRLEGWEGDDQLFGGADNDVLAGDFGRYELPLTRVPFNYRVMPGAVGPFSGDASAVDQVGNDFLDGGSGNDQLYGEAGDDTLLGRDGTDTLFGDASYLPDELHGADFVDGGAGADTIFGNAGDDRLFGGADNDSISGDAGADHGDGGPGDDSLSGGEGNDILEGGEGADVLTGDAGSDVLDGGNGNDQLAGGEDDDVLRGDAGADSLDGGAGADSLYGGSGEDVLFGGDDNDLIDGGAGIDLVRGGAGDDTYVFGLGYGQDVIEDGEGTNRLAFGAGIAAEDLSASLDGATLSATITFGGAGDSAALNMGTFQVGGVDFANGMTWGRREFLGFMLALVSAGSDSGEVLAGNDRLRNELRGFGGDDYVTGSANDDLLDGGEGADSLDGAAGSDVYVFTAADSGIDALADSQLQARAYLDWYYGNLGIAEWTERGLHGGKYKAVFAAEGDVFTGYYDSLEQASTEFSFAEISFVEPLPSIAPLVRRDDETALDALVAAGVLSRDVAQFGPGLALSDLTLSVTVDAVEAAGHPDQPWYSGGTLFVRWGDAGFDLEVPGINYGFAGSNLLTDGFESDTPGAWRGYRLGEGIEAFRFADGTTYSLEDILRQAEVVEVAGDYAFSRGSGLQIISRNYGNVVFDASIRSDDIAVSRDGSDLLLTLADGSAQGRIVGWYADPASMPELALQFASDPQIDAAALTELGLQATGTPQDDVIAGLDGFSDLLAGGAGNDTLDGGTGKDTYFFNRGDGVDSITETPSGAGDPDASVIVFGDISLVEARFELGSLLVDLGDGDAIHFTAFNASDPYSTPVFDRLEFAGGDSLAYEDVLANGFELFGGEGDDVITGTGVNDFIDGGAGNDTLYGLGGEDSLQGGDGADTYVYAAGDGNDYVVEWDETPGEVDTLRLQGIEPHDVRVTRDDFSYYLVLDNGDRLVLDSAAQESVAEIERIEFGDDTVWSPAELAARVELLPGTQFDDPLWGTPDDDVLEGLGGNDALFGNGGDDLLVGGEGSDAYFFAPGHGADVLDNYDSDGSPDYVIFSQVASTDATLARSGDSLVFRVGADRLSLQDWYVDPNRKIENVFFNGDGVSWDAAILEELAPLGGNTPPEVSNPIAGQAGTESSAFSFTVPADTFSDPDAGDVLTYAASLADGSALPSWLSFDNGDFNGTAGYADGGEYLIQVTASDTAGASAVANFGLTVSDSLAIGNRIIGTRRDDVLNGTSAGELLDGRGGADRLLAGGGDDVLRFFADERVKGKKRSHDFFDGGEGYDTLRGTDEHDVVLLDDRDAGPRLAGIEYISTGEGHDLVDLTSGRFAYGDVILDGGEGHDVLRAASGNDVLLGGKGNDELSGGAGQDIYIHARRGGNDEIDEAGIAGEIDVLRFGEGITRDMVGARRHHDDLVLDVAGPHGSVTVKGWFASETQRIELIEFADGTALDETIVRRLVRQRHDNDWHEEEHCTDDRHDERRNAAPQSRRDRGDDRAEDRDDGVAAISERLWQKSRFDFESLARELDRSGKQDAALSAQEIARQWAAVHRYTSALALEADEHAGHAALTGWRSFTASGLQSAGGFGFEASTGATRGPESLESLEGLNEGFRRL